MNRLIPFLILLASALMPATAAPPMEETPALGPYFATRNVRGTFVLLDAASGATRGWDAKRAGLRFVPASTFKIVNALIGLDAGAVENADVVLPYGGGPQFIKDWEHDMSLREGMKLSAVPIYQELARRIGLQRMRAGVEALGYGNQEIGTAIDQFWLRGPLAISAIEQAAFLARLAEGKLPMSARAIQQVQDITLQQTGPGYELHFKTGWAASTTSQIGWMVGWIKKEHRVFSFALNIDMQGIEEASKRIVIAKDCLVFFGVLPKAP
jgi:beta-lactamase class D OXA-50